MLIMVTSLSAAEVKNNVCACMRADTCLSCNGMPASMTYLIMYYPTGLCVFSSVFSVLRVSVECFSLSPDND